MQTKNTKLQNLVFNSFNKESTTPGCTENDTVISKMAVQIISFKIGAYISIPTFSYFFEY